MTEIRQPSPRRGTNLPRMGDFNLTVILDAIRRSPAGLSRVELAQIVGLSPQTISNISRRLLDQDLIYEAGKEGTGPGKPRTMLRLKSVRHVRRRRPPGSRRDHVRGAGPGRSRGQAFPDQDPGRQRPRGRHRHHRRRNQAAHLGVRRRPGPDRRPGDRLARADRPRGGHRRGPSAPARLGPRAAPRRPGRGHRAVHHRGQGRDQRRRGRDLGGRPQRRRQLRLYVHGHRNRLRDRAQ